MQPLMFEQQKRGIARLYPFAWVLILLTLLVGCGSETRSSSDVGGVSSEVQSPSERKPPPIDSVDNPLSVEGPAVPRHHGDEAIRREAVDATAQLAFARAEQRRARAEALLDPRRDGWESEAVAEAAKKQLQGLFETGDPGPYAERESTATRLPEPVPIVFEQPGLTVRRIASSSEMAALPLALETLLGKQTAGQERRIHVKIVGVTLSPQARGGQNAETVALLETYMANRQGSSQRTARLVCQWKRDRRDPDHPRLICLSIEDFEQVDIAAKDGRWFVDLSAALFDTQACFRDQLAFGLNHWSQRIGRVHAMDDTVRNGLAIGDANGDGLEDVYVCQGPGLPNRLLLQTNTGAVRDVAQEAGVDWLDQTSSALFLDLDNDGDQDLTIATSGGLLIMENDGNAHFLLRAQLGSRTCDPQSLSAADYDRDGDLDLFLCVYRPDQAGRRGDFIFHDATTGGSNRLFRNDLPTGAGSRTTPQPAMTRSTWTFTDVTQQSGLHEGATRYSLASAWEDYDGDGDQDLYVANDYGRNYLYRNDQGTFRDVTQSMGLADTGFGMSASWGDADRDGRPDLYIGNMFSSAGSRITRQLAFQTNATDEHRALYQRMAKGNSLFRNTEDGFIDISQSAHVEMGRWAWSSVFADINNDGWEDLLVANGYITTDDTGDL